MAFIGDVLTSKDNETGQVAEGKYYLKVTGLKDGESITLRNGDIVDLKTAEVFFAGLVDAGIMTAEQRAERLNKTPSFVRLKASVNTNKINGRNGNKAAI